MNNPFFQLQADAATRLDCPELAAVPRLTEDPRDPLNAAFTALYQGSLPTNPAGKAGVCLVLQTPTAQGSGGGTELVVGELALRLAIYELVPLNRDAAAGIGLAALDVLWLALQRLQGWAQSEAVAPLEFASFTSDEDPDRPGLLAYFATFRWSGGFSAPAD